MRTKSEIQLDEWVKGNPIHNDTDDECCPDFSCCKPEMLAPLETRERFAQAEREGDDTTKTEMLGMFLGGAFSGVYVAGLEIPEEEH